MYIDVGFNTCRECGEIVSEGDLPDHSEPEYDEYREEEYRDNCADVTDR
jgi:hypothetical protein